MFPFTPHTTLRLDYCSGGSCFLGSCFLGSCFLSEAVFCFLEIALEVV
jgi:hypothetical protein